eukprot:scaffold1806_cov240-Pinguiococcus_pyrenoidosus.AAC.5
MARRPLQRGTFFEMKHAALLDHGTVQGALERSEHVADVLIRGVGAIVIVLWCRWCLCDHLLHPGADLVVDVGRFDFHALRDASDAGQGARQRGIVVCHGCRIRTKSHLHLFVERRVALRGEGAGQTYLLSAHCFSCLGFREELRKSRRSLLPAQLQKPDSDAVPKFLEPEVLRSDDGLMLVFHGLGHGLLIAVHHSRHATRGEAFVLLGEIVELQECSSRRGLGLVKRRDEKGSRLDDAIRTAQERTGSETHCKERSRKEKNQKRQLEGRQAHLASNSP